MSTSTTATKQPSNLSSDPTLTPFLTPTFSPITYLNSTLPIWTPSTSNQSQTQHSSQTQPPSQPQSRATTLPDLTQQTQSQITNLDAKLSRLSHTLTQLTDEIIRSGSRLAYEVDMLRSDSAGLSEALRDQLGGPMKRFVPQGNDMNGAGDVKILHAGKSGEGIDEEHRDTVMQGEETTIRPKALIDLHTLTLLRTRLTAVISTFESALAWPVPPPLPSSSSSTSTAGGIISVQPPKRAPKPGIDGTNMAEGSGGEELEAKAREFEARVREEVLELLELEEEGGGVEGNEGGEGGVSAARRKVEELRDLLEVWRGTGEERARGRYVEGLVGLIDEREGVER